MENLLRGFQARADGTQNAHLVGTHGAAFKPSPRPKYDV